MAVLAKWRGERAVYNGYQHRSTFIDGSRLLVGRCLQWVRGMFGVAAMFRYAYDVWLQCPAEYRHATSVAPPRGSVALYRSPNTSGRPGHIAIGLGGGKILSTDLPTGGKVGVVHYMDPVRRWGHSYVGYCWWINGKVITAPFIDVSDIAEVARRSKALVAKNGGYGNVRDGAVVKQVEHRLWKRRLLAFARVNTTWNKIDTAAYARWQRILGYSGSEADGVPGLASIRALCRREPYGIGRQ